MNILNINKSLEQQLLFDVIVVGAGHAGTEAAHIAAKMGSKTLLLTIDENKIAVLPCNPSIGGLGKGHLVFEISALGGLMPKLCAQTYLQARMLNTSKGPAVQGLRVQIDKFAYSQLAKKIILETQNLTLKAVMVTKILSEQKKNKTIITGVQTKTGETYFAKSIIITSGTFLNGVIHIGNQNKKGGRDGEEAVEGLTENLEKLLNIKIQRLKTGTPPRLLKETIDYSKLEKQEPTQLDFLYEFKPIKTKETIPCFITHTNENTCKIIDDNINESALYGGYIIKNGPRYCPAIEDKVRKFPQRKSHHVFIEPESISSDEIYPAGIATSLPLEIQKKFVNSIPGLENAKITSPGYAIEYDFVQPKILNHTLETKNVSGLFFAGQINGTTGYEEAAALGLIAGINAHLKNKNQDPFILERTESYIGVMIDDLITLGIDEPYRMFTSRAERRLLLRQDNVFLRLMPYGKKLGTISEKTYKNFLDEKEIIEKSIELINKLGTTSQIYKLFNSIEFDDEIKEHAKELLLEQLKDKNLNLNIFSGRTLLTIHAQIKYSGYLQKEQKEAEKLQKYKDLKIHAKINYEKMPGLSRELQEKLKFYKPENIAQAQLIPGITPAAISILIFQSKALEKKELINRS